LYRIEEVLKFDLPSLKISETAAEKLSNSSFFILELELLNKIPESLVFYSVQNILFTIFSSGKAGKI
jgi:hypothetical protein